MALHSRRLSLVRCPATPSELSFHGKLLANANPHIGIALFRRRLGGPVWWGSQRCTGCGVAGSDLHTRQLCFLQLFLRHTLRGTLRELAAAGMHSRVRVGGVNAEDSSRVFLVLIHNCKFPSAYLCSFRTVFPAAHLIAARVSELSVDERNFPFV